MIVTNIYCNQNWKKAKGNIVIEDINQTQGTSFVCELKSFTNKNGNNKINEKIM